MRIKIQNTTLFIIFRLPPSGKNMRIVLTEENFMLIPTPKRDRGNLLENPDKVKVSDVYFFALLNDFMQFLAGLVKLFFVCPSLQPIFL